MFICADCDCIFDEPEYYVEKHGLNIQPFEKISGCPLCGGYYVETFMCDICNEYITDNYIFINGVGNVCETCYTAKSIYDW